MCRLWCILGLFLSSLSAAAQSPPTASIEEIEAVARSHFAATAAGAFKLPELRPLQPTAVSHALAAGDRTLHFTAEAGSVVISDRAGTPIADVRYFAYLLQGTDPGTRPVTFAINGGPGAPSVWLHFGGLGPWRLPVTQREPPKPVSGAALVPNLETWLDFTCRSAPNTDPPKARTSAKPYDATLRCAPPALALRRHNLEGGQLFDADPGQPFGAV
jgi:carboxypeptidase C (cathepsin A)